MPTQLPPDEGTNEVPILGVIAPIVLAKLSSAKVRLWKFTCPFAGESRARRHASAIALDSTLQDITCVKEWNPALLLDCLTSIPMMLT